MKLKEFRQKLNLSQIELAKQLTIPQQTYCSYETGRSQPNIETLIKIADYFNISIDQLVGRPTKILNRMMLNERENSIIEKLLKMNDKQQELTEFYIDTLLGSL